MTIAQSFTNLLTTAEKRRNRFVSPAEYQLNQACEARRLHREAQRGMGQ